MRRTLDDRETGASDAKGRSEIATYVAALSADLSRLSRQNGLMTLSYLLDMARLEAEGIARSGREVAGEERRSDPGVGRL